MMTTTLIQSADGIHLPNFHAGQEAVFWERKRFNWLSAGRRWRKTTMCMCLSVIGAVAKQEIIWGAPTYDQCRVGWDELRHACGPYAEFHEGRMECRLPQGGIIRFRSLDNPDNARGHTADGVVIDEAAYCSPVAWSEVIRPMLIDTKGWAWLVGTPAGRNWFWRGWVEAHAGEIADSIAWQAPALGVVIHEGRLIRDPHPLENPEIPFEELQQLFRSQPERSFRQEVLAEFVEDGGGVFRNVRAVSVLSPGEPVPLHVYCCGIDWGRTHDFSVFTVWDATEKRQVWLERMTGVDFVTQGNRLVALCERWRPDSILAESNSIGRPMIEYLQREGLPVRGFEMTHASKLKLIDSYALGFERKAFGLLDDEQQVREHEAFEQQTLPGGLIRFTAPEGEYDDTVIANALAWQQAQGVGDEPMDAEEAPPVPTIAEAYPALAERFKGLVRSGRRDERKGRW